MGLMDLIGLVGLVGLMSLLGLVDLGCHVWLILAILYDPNVFSKGNKAIDIPKDLNDPKSLMVEKSFQ